MTTNLIALAITFGILWFVATLPAKADPFWDSYNSVQNSYNGAYQNGMAAQQLRASEAMINLERRRQGLPPCSIGLIGQWQGRPAC